MARSSTATSTAPKSSRRMSAKAQIVATNAARAMTMKDEVQLGRRVGGSLHGDTL
jgi:hypothetical protein